MKRKILGIVMTLLLMGILTSTFDIQPAKASGTIYIRADGSIDPPTTNITTLDCVTYTFTGNITDSDGIIIERDNITIDGNGYTLQGSVSELGIGIIVGSFGKSRNNVTIKNINIQKFTCGIQISASSYNNKIIGNNITNNYMGIRLYESPYNSLFGNNIATNNHTGIELAKSNYNSIFGNNIATNNEGINLMLTHHNNMSLNDIANNICGINITASIRNSIYHNNFVNNQIQADIHEFTPNFASNNTWDNGYPSGGNYWSDYNGKDTNGDGIGDIPYIIDENNKDHYPLMDRYLTPEEMRMLVYKLRDKINNLNAIINELMIQNQTNTQLLNNASQQINNLEQRIIDIENYRTLNYASLVIALLSVSIMAYLTIKKKKQEPQRTT